MLNFTKNPVEILIWDCIVTIDNFGENWHNYMKSSCAWTKGVFLYLDSYIFSYNVCVHTYIIMLYMLLHIGLDYFC